MLEMVVRLKFIFVGIVTANSLMHFKQRGTLPAKSESSNVRYDKAFQNLYFHLFCLRMSLL
jgi:hypothetical protein